MPWCCLHWMVIPIVSHTKCKVKSMILSDEHRHFSPHITSANCYWATPATSLAFTQAHTSDGDLHSEDHNQDVEYCSLTEPKRKMRRQSVICKEVGDNLQWYEDSINIKHPPIEPSPFSWVLWTLFHRFCHDPPLKNLMRNIEDPRDNLSNPRFHVTSIFWYFSSIWPLRVLNNSISVPCHTKLIFKTFDTESAIKPNLSLRVTPDD